MDKKPIKVRKHIHLPEASAKWLERQRRVTGYSLGDLVHQLIQRQKTCQSTQKTD